jgi:hypothetical protein
LKKRTKKLLPWGHAHLAQELPHTKEESFLLLFFKKEALPFAR